MTTESIKVTSLKIKNIGKIADETIELNQPLILFYGDIRQGKSTILNAVRWVCGGDFPSDIIRHGQKEGSIELGFNGGIITRSFYRSETTKETKARSVTFIRNGKPVPSPVGEIKKLLNPFLLDQNFLIRKTELERKRFFTELFAVDTTDLDTENFNLDRKASALRSEIKGFGDIDLTKYEPVDTQKLSEARAKIVAVADEKRKALENKLAEINQQNETAAEEWSHGNQRIISHNATVDRKIELSKEQQKEVDRLKDALAAAETALAQTTGWLAENQKKVEKSRPKPTDTESIKSQILALHTPDTSEIDKQLSNASAQNVRAEQYAKNLDRAKARDEKQKELQQAETRQRKIKAEKIAKLKGVSETSGIKGLVFDETGDFIYDGTQAGMLSTSQLMQLSSELSALYPEGLGVELMDGAESLGKSIFEFVDRAKSENKTILATIVGERPANVPASIGVFVVEDGKVVS